MAERTSLALGAAVVGGGLVAVQARINGELAQHLHDALLAAVVSFGSGLVVITAVVLLRGSARAGWHRLQGVPWWARLGGLGGATLVAAAAYAAPRIGVALLTVAMVAGQTTGGLLVDQLGLGPGGRHALTAPRLLGAGLCLAAVVLSVSGRGAATGHVALLAMMVAAGLLIALQQAVNGLVRRDTGSATVATLLNFAVGTAALVAAYAVFSSGHAHDWPAADRWWLYVGGLLGVTFIAMAAVVVRTLGVLRLGLATVAGQLVGAIVLDATVPAHGHGVTVTTLLGAALTFVAVGVSGLRRTSRVVST